MALVRTPGMLYPLRGGFFSYNANNGTSFATDTLAAGATLISHTGRVRWSDGGDYSVSKIHFTTGAVTFNAASVLSVGFQERNATLTRGDGTFTHSGTLTGAAVAASGHNVVTLGSTKAADDGSIQTVVFQITSFNTSDSVVIYGMLSTAANQIPAVWEATVLQSSVPNVVFESTGGKFGIMEGCSYIASTSDGPNWDNGSSDPERGCSFSLPFPAKASGIWCAGFRPSDSVTFRVYSDVLGTPSLVNCWTGGATSYAPPGNDMVSASSSNRFFMLSFANEITLSKDVRYGITVEPTSTTNIYIGDLDHFSSSFGNALPGDNVARIQRTGAAAFTVDSTKSIECGFILTALDDGSGGGASGMIVHPGMSGGMRG